MGLGIGLGLGLWLGLGLGARVHRGGGRAHGSTGLPHELRRRGEHAERLRRAELAREDPLGAEAGELRCGLRLG